MPIIRYDLIYNNSNKHPQLDIKDRGIKILKWEAMEISDCIFLEIDKLPNPMPSYIKECQNFKFSKDK